MTDPGEERQDELDLAHRPATRLTARTYPGSQQAGGPGSRCGSDQRAVMPLRVRAVGRGFYLAVWATRTIPAMRLGCGATTRGRLPLCPMPFALGRAGE